MGFKNLFWGFIFLFDFRIIGIDILPDIVAYILFYKGLSILEEKNEFFRKAKKYVFPMIFISILDIYQVTVPISEIGNHPLGLFSVLLGLITLTINMLMVYNICYGIANQAKLISDFELESKANNRWKLYIIINIIIIIGTLLPGLIGILFLVIIVLSITSYLLMLGLMNTASHKLE